MSDVPPPMLETLEPRLMFSANALIITNATLASAFGDVADWYTRKGYDATVLDVADIYTNYSGSDNQQKIRNCITDYHNNHGVEYVLLGGDNTIVPDRNTYVTCGEYTESAMPTDLYYASLSGTWNTDGDANYGEAGQDTDVALTYDVIVSRYPVRTAQHVSDILTKVKAYETTPVSTNWAKDFLFTGEILWNNYGAGTYNGISFDHTVSDAEIKSWTAYDQYIDDYLTGENVDVLFDTDTSWDSSTHGDYELNDANLIAAMGNDYQFMHMATHGNTNLWALENGYWTSYDIEGLTAEDAFNVPIVSTMACITGAFDTAESSLSEAFLRSPYTGTAAYMGCSRYGWGYASTSLGPSIRYAFQYYKELLANGKTLVGDAFKASKEYFASSSSSNGAYRWIMFGLNLQGDPLMQMYTDNPTAVTPTFDSSIFSASQSYTVSGLAAGARVCLWQESSGVYEVGTADANGDFTATVAPTAGTMKLTVIQPNAPVYTADVEVAETIIVDNNDAGFSTTGQWWNSGATDAYSGGSVCSSDETGSATWSFSLPQSGMYRVYAWYASATDSGTLDRDSLADYVVTHANGTNRVLVDQDTGSGAWVTLGDYQFNAGDNSVSLYHDSEDWHMTSADAVKIQPLQSADLELVVDNRDAGFSTSGTFYNSGAADAYNSGSVCTAQNGAEATWSVTLPQSGSYAVYARWASTNADSSGIDRDSKADYTVTHKYGTNKVTVDQDSNSGSWVLLGNYTFDAGSTSVVLSHDSEDWRTTSADAVKFVKITDEAINLIVDDRDSGFSATGTFYNSGAADAYNGGSICSADASATATWTAALPQAGTYAVYARWASTNPDSSGIDRDSKADYTVTHKYGTNKITVDQDNNSGSWVLLGNFTFDAGDASVDLSPDAEDWRMTSADAVKFVKITDQDITLVVDDRDSGFAKTGTFYNSGAADAYNGGSICSADASATATWTATLPQAGTYAVYARWASTNPDSSGIDRDSKADYTVTHKYGTNKITVDQDNNSGSWVLLGDYTFDAGNASVELSPDAEDWRMTSADAVKFVKITDQDITLIVDDRDSGFSTSGTFYDSSATDAWNNGSVCTAQNGAEATWTASLPEAGLYEVFVRYANTNPDSSTADRDSWADYSVSHSYGTSRVTLNQDSQGGQWISIGTYYFASGNRTVTLTADSEDWHYTSADAVKFVRDTTSSNDVIVDNADNGFSSTGTWYNSGVVDSYNSGCRVSSEDGATATWQATLSQGGTYEVYAWYARDNGDGSFADRDSQADYTISHALGTTNVEVNQDISAGQWVLLGSFQFDAGSAGVTLTVDAEDWRSSVADAVRFKKVTDVVDVVTDNADARFETSGTWFNSGSVDAWGSGSIVSGEDGARARWYGYLSQAGSYDIYVWFAAQSADGSFSDRDSQANYVVRHATSWATVKVDQDTNPGQWVKLGTYNLDAGLNRVVLMHDAEDWRMTSADAVRWIRAGAQTSLPAVAAEEEPVVAGPGPVETTQTSVAELAVLSSRPSRPASSRLEAPTPAGGARSIGPARLGSDADVLGSIRPGLEPTSQAPMIVQMNSAAGLNAAPQRVASPEPMAETSDALSPIAPLDLLGQLLELDLEAPLEAKAA